MRCPHCHVTIHAHLQQTNITTTGNGAPLWIILKCICPSCKDNILKLRNLYSKDEYFVYPRFTTRTPVSPEVPSEIAIDYIEACNVLEISSKASAALSRRCLQNILFQQGYKAKNLAKQIDDVLAEEDARKALPSALALTIDAIRNFGNFSAHPIDDKTTLQVIPVEAHEAEFCLDILEDLFDHYYVKPAAALKKKAELDAKLAASGKPPSK